TSCCALIPVPRRASTVFFSRSLHDALPIFFLRWPSLGESGEKTRIDKTLSHDIIASYAMKSGRYNISVEGRNITDQRLYDNYSLQKPGRSFNVKLRYFIM